jgi:glutamate N-acetyltransferase/amino-acid N-acetyltransferase
VKTAIAGSDANWGRVVMAVGKAGEPADRDKLKHLVRRPGRRGKRRCAPNKYDEAAATRAVSGREVAIGVDLGLGRGKARAEGFGPAT